MRAHSIIVCVVGALAAAGCVGSSSNHCNNDLVCPSGMSCSPTGESCVDSDLLNACRGGDDGAPCEVAGLPPATCLGGVCQASRCGDGRITGAEECDGNLFNNKTCQSLGFYEKAGLRCTADCKFDTAQCVGRCGDGIKNGMEQCDGGDLGKATCFTAGFYKAPGLACKTDCTFDTRACSGGRCGDGMVNGLEQCDGGKFTRSCDQMGYAGAMSSVACTSSCTFSNQSCLCSAGHRCKAKTHHCECSKFGCGCVQNQ